MLPTMETATVNQVFVTIANETRNLEHGMATCSYNTFSEASRWIVCVLTLCSNTLTIVTMLKTKQGIGYKGKLYIISLSMADALMAPSIALTLLLYHLDIICFTDVERDVSSLSAIVQKKRLSFVLLSILYNQSVGCALFTLVSVAVDRLVAVSKPVWYKIHVTPSKIKCLLLVLWIYIFTISAVPVLYFGWKVTPDHVLGAYYSLDILPDWCFNYVILPHVYIPILCNIILYSLTLYYIRRLDENSFALKSKNPTQTTSTGNSQFQRSKRFMKMTTATLGFLLLLWAPYTLVTSRVSMTDPANPDWLDDYLIPFAYALMYCNSWVNPVLYCWLNKDYRKAYMRVLGVGGGKASATVHASLTVESVGGNGTSSSEATGTVKHA